MARKRPTALEEMMGARHDCEICRGAGVIRLPLYRRASAMAPTVLAATIEESSRQYPCPECSGQVDINRVAVVDAHAMADGRINDPEFQQHARRTTAYRLIDFLLQGDFITFERGPTDPLYDRYALVATLGVVSKTQVGTMESRIAQRQDQLAKAVANEASKQIDNWGSHYHHSNISKRDAQRFIYEAVKSVSETWSKARAAEQSLLSKSGEG